MLKRKDGKRYTKQKARKASKILRSGKTDSKVSHLKVQNGTFHTDKKERREDDMAPQCATSVCGFF